MSRIDATNEALRFLRSNPRMRDVLVEHLTGVRMDAYQALAVADETTFRFVQGRISALDDFMRALKQGS